MNVLCSHKSFFFFLIMPSYFLNALKATLHSYSHALYLSVFILFPIVFCVCYISMDIQTWLFIITIYNVFNFFFYLGDLPSYITRFQWDMAKYPIKQSLRNIADIISKQIGQIDSDLKTKSNAYNQLKSHLQNMEKKQT